MKFPRSYALLLSPLLITWAIASLALAEPREPAPVSPIRKTVQEMDRSSQQWAMQTPRDTCEAGECVKKVVFLDEEKAIRKIVDTRSVRPDTSGKKMKHYQESYFAADGALIFRFLHDEYYKGEGLLSTHDERYYLRHRKLLAWKTNDRWHSTSDLTWTQTETRINRMADSDRSLSF